MRPLKILFDSNAFFACVSISRSGVHPDAEDGTGLLELANRLNAEVWLTGATKRDIDNSTDPARRRASTLQMRQWKTLEPLQVSPDLVARAGYGLPLSRNDDVDTHMLAALEANAVDILVTQDRALRRHATEAGFGDRTTTIRGGINHLETLVGASPAIPTVTALKAYRLQASDPIFESLRRDYGAEFEPWLTRAQQEHRSCFVVKTSEDVIDALAILKNEDDTPHGLSGSVLKICTFKVAEHAEGMKRGELLLKAILGHAARGNHDYVYVEVFSRHDGVIRLLEQFGFEEARSSTTRNEIVMVKTRRPTPADAANLEPLEYHRRFGPPAVLIERAFVVPVQPRWHNTLFPELRTQDELFPPVDSGNAIVKAYLTKSAIRSIELGSLLLFYRSEDLQAITVVGVVDGYLRSDDPATIRGFVGRRTVYTDLQLQEMCADGQSVLALRFRQDRLLPEPWGRPLLETAHVLAGPPQSILQVTDQRGISWLRQQLNAPP